MLRGRCEHMAIFNYYILERRWMGTLPRKIDYATMTFGATTILTSRNSSMSSAGSDCMERIVRTSRLILNPSNKWSGYHHYNIQPCLEMDFHCHLCLMKGCLSLKPTTKTRPLMLWVPALVAINWLAWCLIILQGQTRQIASGCHGSS